MQIGSAIAIYFIIWWMLFFPMLTIGNRDPDPDAAQVRGADRGAPARPGMGRKIVINTIAATVVFGLVYWLLNSSLTIYDIPLPAAPGT